LPLNPYGADKNLGGTGSGNPKRVVMHQVLDDGITYSELLKVQVMPMVMANTMTVLPQ